MSSTNRTPFTLYDLARVTGGRITPTHENHCLALDGGVCSCADSSYRVVRAPKEVRGR